MAALKNMPISFPGLFGDWEFNPDPVAIDIGHGIYWYGIILAIAMLAGLFLAMKQAHKYGLTDENVLDLVLWAVPLCILGARVYYVLFNLDFYRNADGVLNWGRMIAIWDGGLAIYGAVIAGALVVLVFCRVKKLKFGAFTDLAVLGLLLGQIIGRWANFINREAFGAETDLPWRMRLWLTEVQAVEVHPTFFYESMWNLVGLLLILFVVSKGRRFDGENTWFYFLWYGLGRSWIEGLRSDSLYLFDWTIMGEPIRVSQALSVVMVFVSVGMLFYMVAIRKCTSDGLLVNQLAAARAEALEAEAAELQAEAEDAAAVELAAAAPEGADMEETAAEAASESTDATEAVGEAAEEGEQAEDAHGKED